MYRTTDLADLQKVSNIKKRKKKKEKGVTLDQKRLQRLSAVEYMSLVGIPIHSRQVAGDTLRYSVKSEYGMGVT